MHSAESSENDGIIAVAQLRDAHCEPREYWPRFLGAARSLTGARRVLLTVSAPVAPAAGEAKPEVRWRVLAASPSGGVSLPEGSFLERARTEGLAEAEGLLAFSVGGAEAGEGVVVLEIEDGAETVPVSRLVALLGTLPEAWQSERAAERLRGQVEGLSGALDLGLVVSAHDSFTPAALATCNELAARMRCDRVSLGWQDDTVLRLRAISQADKFDRRADLVRQLEVAMEETFDQEILLTVPLPGGSDAIVREHQAYARIASIGCLCSVPLLQRGKLHGVCMLERAERPFSESEQVLLRVMADQVGPRLAELRERDRVWPVRLWRRLKTAAAGWLGTRHTGPKLVGLAAALGILFLIFGRLPYSVKAPATVRSEQVVFVTAPFDGFIEDVSFEVGDNVLAGAPLVTFDTRELLVQEAAELAELNRYRKEIERARAQNALADMRVAEAQAAQARAVLERTRYHLEQATVTAPIEGVIVEGDLRKRLGAPVQQGEVLLQTAGLKTLYIQIEIPERDVHEVLERTDARMLFAAQPDRSFALEIERLLPGGLPGASGVVFVARARPVEAPPEWWRPGMSGTARIDAGWRNAGWILTHRTTDWLRRQLWW